MELKIKENAFKRVAEVKAQEHKDKLALKVSILGGGCAGFQSKFEFVEEYEENAFVFEKSGAIIVVDRESALFLHNAELDYIEELGYSRFEVSIPNSTSTCGCRKSFAM